MAQTHSNDSTTLSKDVLDALDRAIEQHIPKRIWKRDTSVWTEDPEAVKSVETRLGWLDAPNFSLSHLSEILEFAKGVRNDRYTSAVVFGMGGSSLCVEVLRDVFGVKSGCPNLLTLDSTHPDQIADLERAIDLEKTLFIVASKSGTTLEPECYYQYFWDKLNYLGADRPKHFAAITDPGTPLEKMANEKGFRAVFTNPADIGGRYSALSYFGMVPAALAGIEIEEILSRASSEAGLSHAEEDRNTSLNLGVFLGHHAQQGRDKLTIIAKGDLASFGYWAEQLIAESTGKQGKGILPIEGESDRATQEEADRRVYVHLTLGEESISEEDVKKPNHMDLHLFDKYGLGAQFFRWEFATAVAGEMLGINPFDEPNVAEAKAKTNAVLNEQTGNQALDFPDVNGEVNGITVAGEKPGDTLQQTLDDFLARTVQSDGYIAIMAYVNRNEAAMGALATLREKLSLKYHVPVTVGFGPRFLHSTGQLHKGGPGNGTFIQIIDKPKRDLPIPGKPFSFATLIRAQAIGDFETLQAHERAVISLDLGTASIEALSNI